MGDFERTFGAGADAADIIDSFARDSSGIEPPAPLHSRRIPDGMPKIEVELLKALWEHSDEMADNWGVSPDSMFNEWDFLKIVATMPTTVEAMEAIPQMRSSGCTRGFIEWVLQAKAKQETVRPEPSTTARPAA